MRLTVCDVLDFEIEGCVKRTVSVDGEMDILESVATTTELSALV